METCDSRRKVKGANIDTIRVVKLFNADGTPIPGASVTVSTAGKPAGQFTYAALGTAVTPVGRGQRVELQPGG